MLKRFNQLCESAYEELREKVVSNDLFVLCEKGTMKQVQEAIANGADINEVRDGITPLLVASSANVAGLLIKKGADINVKDKIGNTPLLLACVSWTTIVDLLLKNGANIKDKNLNNENVLHKCTNPGYRDGEVILETLLSKGAKEFINEKDKNGMTPLLYCVKSRNIYSLRVMLKYKPDYKVVDAEGKNIIDIAKALKFGGQPDEDYISEITTLYNTGILPIKG